MFLTFRAGSQPASVSPPQPDIALQILLDSLLNELGFPGATAAFVLPNGTVKVASTGLANREDSITMKPTDRMLMASIGKTFVGALAAILTSDGVMKLDTPASAYLGKKSWFDQVPNSSLITLRQLLTHTSGLPDHVYMPEFAADVAQLGTQYPTFFTPQVLVGYILDKPAVALPGQSWSYSDTGYILAGLAIESATGRDLFDLMEERLTGPFQLGNTTPADTCELDGLVRGYTGVGTQLGFPEVTTDGQGDLLWNPAMEWAGGGLISNSYDLAKWSWLLYGQNGVAFSGFDELVSTVTISPDTDDSQYGLGVSIHQHEKFGAVYGHAGWIPGYCSSMRYYADYKISVAFQINTDIGIADTDVNTMKLIEDRLARFVIHNPVSPIEKQEQP
jgi:D-alanyl-D-alanine carboxypeptidase